MHGVWLTHLSEPIFVVAARRATPEHAEPLPADVAAWRVETWFARPWNSTEATILVALHDLAARRVTVPRDPDGWRDLRNAVRLAFSEGRLIAYRLRPRLAAVTPPPAPAPAPKARDERDTHWIEIVAVDDADRPMPHLRYHLKLPDGSIAEGRLDREGRAHVKSIPGGACALSFPDLHGPDWALAGAKG
ncbi:Hypothetical protein A7982_11376 [Minicystis rosea]|nr:Hypothetical protein A7982_11376 [Minicystis rosea]